ncbi:MAG: hypothetical protein ABL309_02690 [Phycisphaerales bacterium]
MSTENRGADAISIIEELRSQIPEVKSSPHMGARYKKWKRDVSVALERIFGSDSRHISDFGSIRFYPNSIFLGSENDYEIRQAYEEGFDEAKAILLSFCEEIQRWGIGSAGAALPIDGILENIFNRFHLFVRQLRDRYGNRDTIDVSDEYDVQDVMHAILRLHFDDVRKEEYSPSYAGSSTRQDFLLKNEQVVIEIKKTRRGLSAVEVGEQLIVDCEKYRAHPSCKKLLCFVYDPEGLVANPRGLEQDLEKTEDGFSARVYVRP